MIRNTAQESRNNDVNQISAFVIRKLQLVDQCRFHKVVLRNGKNRAPITSRPLHIRQEFGRKTILKILDSIVA